MFLCFSIFFCLFAFLSFCNTQHTTHYTQHTTQSTLHTAHNTQHKAHSTQHTAHNTQHTAHNTQHTAHYTYHTTHITQHKAHNIQHTSHNTQHTTHSTECNGAMCNDILLSKLKSNSVICLLITLLPHVPFIHVTVEGQFSVGLVCLAHPQVFAPECTDCTDYTDSISCIECVDCIECIDCFHCSDCSDCIDCTGCTDCIDCTNCTDCIDCTGCTDCIDCTNCTGAPPFTLIHSLVNNPDIERHILNSTNLEFNFCQNKVSAELLFTEFPSSVPHMLDFPFTQPHRL